ncbi:hypothetical protein [Vibrio owensii]|uniref:hypothetical protein n=1 Tax=Vibrio harveyi group TaxID=717610 RepID=UPI003CC5607A
MKILDSDEYYEFIGFGSHQRQCLNEMMENPYTDMTDLAWILSGNFYRLQTVKGTISSSFHAEKECIVSLMNSGYIDSLGMATDKLYMLKRILNEIMLADNK